MPIIHRLDPELAAGVQNLPATDITEIADIPEVRRAAAKRTAMLIERNAVTTNPAVIHTDHFIPGEEGDPSVKVRVFRPRDTDEILPCLYWIQGGGYVITSMDLDDTFCEEVAALHRCSVVSVSWRRAPEHPFPAAARDCYVGLSWTIENGADLRIDPTRVAIGGRSSGGGSAAGLALMVRDRGELQICHQLLLYPMLDDTTSLPSTFAVIDKQVWNRTNNQIAWQAYLGDTYGTDRVSPYAAPARMEDLSGLAPATVLVGELDLFLDEDIAYAQRLMQAGIPTELHVYAAAHHGFDRLVPSAVISQRLNADRDAALYRAFNRYNSAS